MEKKAKVPKLRFPGFTEDWEQRKVIDVAPLQRGFDLPTSKMEDGNYPVVMSNGINGYHSEFKVRAPGVVTGRSGTIGKLHYIEDNYWPHNTTLWVTDFKGNDSWYVYYMYQKLDLSQFSTGSGVPTLNRNDVHNAIVDIPTLDEQVCISRFFNRLDNLITLHQRKLTHLQAKKKSLLQKMFPKKGERFPELRFPGFTDAWEQRKLGEISEKITTKNSSLEYTETFTNSAEYGIISQRDFFDKDISNKANLTGYYIVQDDDFVYNPRISTTAPVGPIKRNKLGRTGVMSPLYYVFKTHDIDNIFLEKYFGTTGWHEFMYLNGDSGARADRFAIKDAVLCEMPVPYPSVMEQKKIGQFLKNLDHLITLHQRKLAHLQTQKKALLQQMFV